MSLKRSIVWNILIPLPIVMLVVIVIAWVAIPKLVISNMLETTKKSATQTTFQFKTLRGYYNKNIIAKAKASGALRPAIEHEGIANAIPLPATMIQDLSALLSKEDTTLALYSPFPFKNRAKRKLDTFQQEAWNYFKGNPDGVYSKTEKRGDATIMRVAVADKMVGEGCVSCHNSHVLSTKKDWKLGDVRGVLEVDTDISGNLIAAKDLKNTIMIGIIMSVLILLAV
jgi:hypothetical protein